MPRSFNPLCAIVMIAISCNVIAHDEWDVLPSFADNTSASTRNLLLHAAPAQVHDLNETQSGVPDRDWFVLNLAGHRSFEVRVMNVTQLTLTDDPTHLTRHSSDGSTLQTSVPLGTNAHARTLRWIESSPLTSTHVRVTNDDPILPGPISGVFAKYTIKLYETTLYCPRYNNSGSQVSVLIVQHSAPEVGACSFTARFHAANATETGATTVAISTNNLSVINTTALAGVAGTSGSAFIAHTCGIGGIKAKLVALEPATGFSFDTPCSMREY